MVVRRLDKMPPAELLPFLDALADILARQALDQVRQEKEDGAGGRKGGGDFRRLHSTRPRVRVQRSGQP